LINLLDYHLKEAIKKSNHAHCHVPLRSGYAGKIEQCHFVPQVLKDLPAGSIYLYGNLYQSAFALATRKRRSIYKG
jgi:hypothetical protein